MKIKINEYDDWIEIYMDNKLLYENHSISPTKLLDILEIKYESEFIEEENDAI